MKVILHIDRERVDRLRRRAALTLIRMHDGLFFHGDGTISVWSGASADWAADCPSPEGSPARCRRTTEVRRGPRAAAGGHPGRASVASKPLFQKKLSTL